jgi:hypothetical protein
MPVKFWNDTDGSRVPNRLAEAFPASGPGGFARNHRARRFGDSRPIGCSTEPRRRAHQAAAEITGGGKVKRCWVHRHQPKSADDMRVVPVCALRDGVVLTERLCRRRSPGNRLLTPLAGSEGSSRCGGYPAHHINCKIVRLAVRGARPASENTDALANPGRWNYLLIFYPSCGLKPASAMEKHQPYRPGSSGGLLFSTSSSLTPAPRGRVCAAFF